MIYVIEGPDRAGKSSFIDRLRNKIQNPKVLVIHSSRPPSCIAKDEIAEWTITYYDQLINTAISLSEQGYEIILDRSWLSECIYGPIYRNVNIPLSILESHLYEHADKFVICYLCDSAKNLIAREDGESDAKSIDEKDVELKSFIRVIRQSNIHKHMIINWEYIKFSKDSLDDFANKLINLK